MISQLLVVLLITSSVQSAAISYEEECLMAHNFYRALHPGTPPLKWNSELAKDALRWANDIAERNARGHDPNKKDGENVARRIGVIKTCADAVHRWYMERKDYNFNDPGPTRGPNKIGHFTQVVWKGSLELGMATVSKQVELKNGKKVTKWFTVARYRPGGNHQNRARPKGQDYQENVLMPNDKPWDFSLTAFRKKIAKITNTYSPYGDCKNVLTDSKCERREWWSTKFCDWKSSQRDCPSTCNKCEKTTENQAHPVHSIGDCKDTDRVCRNRRFKCTTRITRKDRHTKRVIERFFVADRCKCKCGHSNRIARQVVKDEVQVKNDEALKKITLKEECLEAHNFYRALHPGTPPLTWDDRLQREAQTWADKLATDDAFHHDEGRASSYKNGETIGENIAQQEGGMKTCAQAVKGWYDERKLYSYNQPEGNEGTGHFTQLIWKESNKLGVAIASREVNGRMKYWTVARYMPAGNNGYAPDYRRNVLPANNEPWEFSLTDLRKKIAKLTNTLSPYGDCKNVKSDKECEAYSHSDCDKVMSEQSSSEMGFDGKWTTKTIRTYGYDDCPSTCNKCNAGKHEGSFKQVMENKAEKETNEKVNSGKDKEIIKQVKKTKVKVEAKKKHRNHPRGNCRNIASASFCNNVVQMKLCDDEKVGMHCANSCNRCVENKPASPVVTHSNCNDIAPFCKSVPVQISCDSEVTQKKYEHKGNIWVEEKVFVKDLCKKSCNNCLMVDGRYERDGKEENLHDAANPTQKTREKESKTEADVKNRQHSTQKPTVTTKEEDAVPSTNVPMTRLPATSTMKENKEEAPGTEIPTNSATEEIEESNRSTDVPMSQSPTTSTLEEDDEVVDEEVEEDDDEDDEEVDEEDDELEDFSPLAEEMDIENHKFNDAVGK